MFVVSSFLSILVPAPASAFSLSDPVVFVSRDLGDFTQPPSRETAIEHASSGRLLVRDADGELRDLLGSSAPQITDVSDPDVSFDGTRIVFAGYTTEDGAWRIFEIGADGQGLRQITRSDLELDLTRFGDAAQQLAGYDDLDPCYLPDGRICFVSTRHPGIAPDQRLRATNLFLVNEDGSDVHRITSERFGADTPTVEPTTGQIVYSRFWRTGQVTVPINGDDPVPVRPGSPGYGDVELPDGGESVLTGLDEKRFPGINTWFLSSINPDGTDLAMYSSFRLDRELTQAYRPSFIEAGEVAALFIPLTPILGMPGENGIRLYRVGASRPRAVSGPQTFPGSNSEPGPDGAVDLDPPVLQRPRDMAPFVYNAAVGIGGDRLLVSGSPTQQPGLDYGLYIIEDPADGVPLPVLDLPGTAELDPALLVAREEPPVIPDRVSGRLGETEPQTIEEAIERNGTFTFAVQNIFGNAPVDVAIPSAPPIGQRLSIEFYMNPQRTSPNAGDPPILIARRAIPPDGKVEIDLPAGVPLFEVLRQADNTIPISRDGQIFHVGGMNFGRAGETSKCIGCHSGHSALSVPDDSELTNVAPGAFVKTSSVRDGRRTDDFSASHLVDRRTDSLWSAATRDPVQKIQLSWGARVSATELVLYAVPPAPGNSLQVADVQVETRGDGGNVMQSFTVASALAADGTRIEVNPQAEFSSLQITIPGTGVTGFLDQSTAPAIAEIEVIGRATSEALGSFLRADVDCSDILDISDPIILLTHLFLGLDSICCEAAADANDDRLVDISDPITMLSFMFIGTPMVNAGRCEPLASSSLTCAQPFCQGGF